MAPNVTVHFWDANDINGTPILEITDEDTFFKGLTLKPDLYSVGGWELTLARAWGFQLFGSGAVAPEVFVRFIVHAFDDETYYYGGQLDKRNLIVVHRQEIGEEQLVIGGRGPKAYLDRSALGIEQRTGLGFNLDLDNGVWRWNEAASAGRVLDTVVDEDAARSNPSLPDLTVNFSDTNDSDGTPWTNEVTPGNGEYETPVGSSLLDVLWDLEDSAELYSTVHLGVVGAPQYQLNAFQVFGDDNTGTNPGAGVCIFREGLNIANDSLTVEGVAIRKASHVIVEGKDGVWITEVRPTWSPGDYVKWDKIEYSRSSSEDILHRVGLRWLQRQNNGDQQLTVEILPGNSDATGYYFPAPNRVLWLGNTITLDTVADGSVHSPLDYNNADALVTGWELSLGEAGDDSTADRMAKSWTVKVNLNHERAGFASSPNQTSAATGGNQHCACPPLCHPTVEGTPDVEVKYYSGGSDDPGGDAINWDGILENQGSAGQGAEGSNAYCFKSAAPDQFQESWAASTGAQYVIIGFVGCTSDGFLTFDFFSDPAGTDPPVTSLQHNVLSPAQPNHEHAPEWTAFAAGPFTAPSGTNSAALGRDVGVDFDEVHIILLGTGSENPYAGTDFGTARCDHNHPASDIEVTPAGTVTSDNVQDALEEIAEDYQQAIDDAISAISSGSNFLSQFDDGFIGRRFLIGAHGGDIGNNGDTGDSWPQGSLQAHRQAALKGADYSDVDCRLTSDGVWVSYHDASITAGTNGTGNVDAITAATFTAAEFDSTSIPGYNTSRHGTSVSLVTVQDIMDAVRPYGMSLQLELKPTDDDAATSLAELVVENHYEDRCYIHCTSDTQSAAVKVVSSRILVGRNYPDLPDVSADIFSIAYTSATTLAIVTAEAPLIPSSNMPIGEYGDSEDTIMQNMYDRGIRMWTSNDLDSALGFANGIVAGLGQVLVTDPQDGDMLRYTGGQWVNTPGRWEPVTAGAGIFVFDGDDIVMGWTDT